jgi:hypothetical protein
MRFVISDIDDDQVLIPHFKAKSRQCGRTMGPLPVIMQTQARARAEVARIVDEIRGEAGLSTLRHVQKAIRLLVQVGASGVFPEADPPLPGC